MAGHQHHHHHGIGGVRFLRQAVVLVVLISSWMMFQLHDRYVVMDPSLDDNNNNIIIMEPNQVDNNNNSDDNSTTTLIMETPQQTATRIESKNNNNNNKTEDSLSKAFPDHKGSKNLLSSSSTFPSTKPNGTSSSTTTTTIKLEDNKTFPQQLGQNPPYNGCNDWSFQQQQQQHDTYGSYAPLAKYVTGKVPNAITINVTNPNFHGNNNNKNNHNQSGGVVVVDVMSIGSQLRLDYMTGQIASWASHPQVRHFWGFSEHDDLEPNCSLAGGFFHEPSQHFFQCKRKRPRASDSALLKWFQMSYGAGTRHKGIGWLCAQVRFGQSLGRIGAEYQKRLLQQNNHHQNMTTVLPDYLLLVDDDTYVNVELVITQQIHHGEMQQNSHMARSYGGCVFYDSRINLTLPIGGYALMLSKGAIARLITPIYCSKTINNNKTNNNYDYMNDDANRDPTSAVEFQSKVCRRLDDNLLREKEYFTNGMSLSDLGHAMSRNASQFCLNADWLYAYLIGYYYLSSQAEPRRVMRQQEQQQHLPSLGYLIHPYDDSRRVGNRPVTRGQCLFGSVEACTVMTTTNTSTSTTTTAYTNNTTVETTKTTKKGKRKNNKQMSTPKNEIPHICHYQTPESMMASIQNYTIIIKQKQKQQHQPKPKPIP